MAIKNARRKQLTKTIHFAYGGRQLEIQAKVVGHTLQIWIEENGKPLHLHSAVSRQQADESAAAGQDLLTAVMQAAQTDIQDGKLVLPPQ